MPYGEFPNTLKVIDPATGQKLSIDVKNWDNVRKIQELRYEILGWEK